MLSKNLYKCDYNYDKQHSNQLLFIVIKNDWVLLHETETILSQLVAVRKTFWIRHILNI